MDNFLLGMLDRFARTAFRGVASSERYLDRLMTLFRERCQADEKPEQALTYRVNALEEAKPKPGEKSILKFLELNNWINFTSRGISKREITF